MPYKMNRMRLVRKSQEPFGRNQVRTATDDWKPRQRPNL
jgi:hypothetical protein